MQRSLTIFEESIKTEATRKAYKYQLDQFLKWTKIKDFDSLLQAPQKNIQTLLEDYVMHLKKKVSPNSVPIYYAPIELFFVMNDIIINYKKLRKLFPGKAKKGNQRGYTLEEISKIVKNTKSKRNRALVLLFASSGIRLGGIPDILLKHLSKIGKNSYAIKIYEDDIQEDFVFTTPEATKALDEYLDERKKDGEYIDQDSPLIRTSYKLGIEKAKSCNLDTLAHIMARLVSCIDRKKRGNRFDVPKDHGFRKFYGTVIKNTQGITPTMTEKLINHIGVVQLDGAYFTPTKEQMFEAYQKVISGLTIDQTEKQESLIESQKKKITELSKKDNQIQELAKKLAKIESDQKNNHDVFNTLMSIANGPSWGYSQENIDELWKKINPKINKVIKQINEQK